MTRWRYSDNMYISSIEQFEREVIVYYMHFNLSIDFDDGERKRTDQKSRCI